MKDFQKNHSNDTTFGSRLRLLRQKCGFSQVEFAKKIGYKNSASVSQTEKDTTVPDVNMLRKIAEVLNADLHWLITGTLPPTVKEAAELLKPIGDTWIKNTEQEMDTLRDEKFKLELQQKTDKTDNSVRLKELQDALDEIIARYVKVASLLSATPRTPADPAD